MADSKQQIAAYRARMNSGKALARGPQNNSVRDILASASRLSSAPPPEAPPEKPKDWWETTMEGAQKVSETPVIKQVIDALAAVGAGVTTPIYNVQQDFQDAADRGRARAIAKGQDPHEGGDLANRLETIGDGLNPLNLAGSIAGGLGDAAGLMFLGKREPVKYGHHIISDAQEYSGIDPESSESKWVSGLGGFAIDVALDPLNAVTALGKGAAAVSGGVRGADKFRSEMAGKRHGADVDPELSPTLWENVKKEAKVDVENYKDLVQHRQTARKTRNSTPEQKAAYFLDNLSVLRPAVARAMIVDDEVAANLTTKLREAEAAGDTAKVAEVSAKLEVAEEAMFAPAAKADEAIEEAIVQGVLPETARRTKSRPMEPATHLSDFKKPSTEERVYEKLSEMRATTAAPIYSPEVIKNVSTALKARPAEILEEVAPVVPSAVVAPAPVVKPGKKPLESPDDAGVVGKGKARSSNLDAAREAVAKKLDGKTASIIDDAYSSLIADLSSRKGTFTDDTGKKVTYKKLASDLDKRLSKDGYDAPPNHATVYNIPTEILKEHGFYKVTGDGTNNVSWGKTAEEAIKLPTVGNRFEEWGAPAGHAPDFEATIPKIRKWAREYQKDAGVPPNFRVKDPAAKSARSYTLEEFLRNFNNNNQKVKNFWNALEDEVKTFRQIDDAPAAVAKAADEAAPVVAKAEEAAPVAAKTDEPAKQVPDFEATIAAIKEHGEQLAIKIPGSSQILNSSEAIINSLAHNGSNNLFSRMTFRNLEEAYPNLVRYKNDGPPAVAKAADEAAPVAKAVEEAAPVAPRMVKNPKAITDKELIELGVLPEHIKHVRAGKSLEEFTKEITTKEAADIAKAIRNGDLGEAAVKQFYDEVGSTDRAKVANFIETIVSTPKFAEAAKALEVYGTPGNRVNPELGVSGHAELSRPLDKLGHTADDILAAKTITDEPTARAFLEARYQEEATNLANHPRGVELRKLADEVFRLAVEQQRTPAGPKVSKVKKASLNEAETAAKFERQHNTHSGLWRVRKIIEEVRKFENVSSRTQFDDMFMSVLRDVDARMQLAGFDMHLNNMAVVGDKTVVRLSPSDALGAFRREDRIKFLWGNVKYANRKELNEFLPSSGLDVAEVIVRSGTKLTTDGKVDFEALYTNVVHALSGTYSKVAKGKREIDNPLDPHVVNKHNEEILRGVDRATNGATSFYEQYRKATSPAKKTAVLDMVKNHETYRNTFTKVASERMDTIVNEFALAALKGLREGTNTVVPRLINLNMRNASVAGGIISKQVAEASEAFTENLLKALDEGTPGDFISTLVINPPFKATDPAAKAVMKENRQLIQNSVATPAEVAHAQASMRNTNIATETQAKLDKAKTSSQRAAINKAARKQAAANNAKAFQKDPELNAELAKPVTAINPEHIMDLARREVARDALVRGFGGKRWFNKRSGIPIAFDTLAASTHSSSLLLTGFHEILRDLVRKGYTDEQLRVAFTHLQRDEVPDQIAGELKAVLDTMFDPSKSNFFDRNSVGLEHLRDVMKSVGFEDKFLIPLGTRLEDIPKVWKSWDVVNVKDFFSKMMGTMIKVSEDVAMGSAFSNRFGKAEWEEGYVKFVDSTMVGDRHKKNPFLPLIDQNLYYPKELYGEMVHIGRLLTETRAFEPGSFTHTFVTKIMDPVISNLKLTQTTMKPGHHTMSIIGDTWRNNLALSTLGVPVHVQVKSYKQSADVLFSSIGEIAELSSYQKFVRTQNITKEIKLQQDGNSGSQFFANIGGGGNISNKDMYAIWQANGVALPAHLGGTAEDILTDFSNMGRMEQHAIGDNKIFAGTAKGVATVTKGLDRLTNPMKPKFGMKRPYSLNKFTAHRDAWTRGALFMGAMRSRNFNNVEEAVAFASQFVKKWAPTAADLGAVESKVLRRAIFYYTWIRGMVPRIIEAGLMKPGVAILPNRAMYNLAVANGLDPQSIGDPFPPGTLLPAWYTERVIGPQWYSHKEGEEKEMWGGNPTGPLGDVLNSLGSNVKPKDFLNGDALGKTFGTVLNMSTPFFKAPMEIIPGRTLETGAPIDNRSQALQDYVGPVRFASRATGNNMFFEVSPTGEIVFGANRTEKKFRNGLTWEETVQNAIPEIANYGLGLGITHYTSDGSSKSAQFQKKAELIEKRREAQRFQ